MGLWRILRRGWLHVSDASARPSRQLELRLRQAELNLTPVEYWHFFRSLRAAHPDNALIASNPIWPDLRSAWWLQRYATTQVSPNVALYFGGGQPGRRGLLICFSGYFGGMTIPTAVFLQAIPARKWDVLVLRDPTQNQFRQGCKGFADTPSGLARRLRDIARPYAKCVVLGASMGGFAAIRVALALPETRGISLGGIRAFDVQRLCRDPSPGLAFDPLCACLPPEQRDLWFLHGGGHKRDGFNANGYAAIVGGSVVGLPGCEKHNVLEYMWRSGKLKRYLAALTDTRLTGQRLRSRLGVIGADQRR